MVRLLFILIMVISALYSGAELNDTRIFDYRFRTLKTSAAGNFMQPAVIRLGVPDDRIIISFDELGEDYSELRYRLIHCNADWERSQLVENEYIKGFNEGEIDDYAWSSNTFVHYVNYRIEIPNDQMQPLTSGNYLLQVYDQSRPDDILLQTRFRVVEPVLTTHIDISTRTDRGVNDRYQQLEVAVEGDNADIGNPFQDLTVVVIQNQRESESHILKAPLRFDGHRAIYAHSPELLFDAGNEFHRFESVSNQFAGMNVDSVRWVENCYHVWLRPDEPRADRNYEYDRTQHGRFLVKEYNATDSSIGADYIMVHFSLENIGLAHGQIYLSGELTRYLPEGKAKMDYNPENGGWKLVLPLKQGAYNYEYTSADGRSAIDGNKYETENEYTVYVYQRKPGDRADRLIGYSNAW